MRRGGQRGASLLEALLAFAVLSLGMLGVARLHAGVQASVQRDAQQMQALRAAQRALEGLRAAVAPLPVVATDALDVVPDLAGARLRLERRLAGDDTASALAWTTIAVDAIDRPGAAPPVSLHSALGRAEAALSGALLLARDAVARVHGRAASIPPSARALGDGRSVWRPASALPLAFVFDDATGRITARCDDERALPDACVALDALLLAGWVRVSLAAPPDAANPVDAALPLAIALSLSQGRLAEPGCLTELRDGALAYHCVIEPDGGAWSGRSDLVPQGWTIGAAAGQYAVCRYVGAAGDAGAGDRNATHPARYDHVDRPLMQQNFLVIRGDQPCPAVPASPTRPGGILTVAHQP